MIPQAPRIPRDLRRAPYEFSGRRWHNLSAMGRDLIAFHIDGTLDHLFDHLSTRAYGVLWGSIDVPKSRNWLLLGVYGGS
jgi:hypothetical protein